MRLFLKLMSALLLASIVLAGAEAASAGSSTITKQTVTGTVNWTLDPAVCKSVKLALAGSGERHEEIITTVYADGSSQRLANDVVKGTAHDSSGSYDFIYTNHSTMTRPPSGSPVQVDMADSFVLNGNGSTGHMEVGFRWLWTFTSWADFFPPQQNLQQINTRGDPIHCDPI